MIANTYYIECVADAETIRSYQQFGKIVDKIKLKGERVMVDIERIKADVERLKTLNAEEYCADQVAKIYAEFEESRDKKIAELEKSLEIFDMYQISEPAEIETDESTEEKVVEV